MASRKVEELPSEVKEFASVSEQLSRCGPDDITDELQSDTMNATGKSQKSGKFRRTALTFFGVRKSICILPSFFGGRSRNQNKWSSKKGITKSRTHDGLSKVGHDDDLRSRCTTAGEFAYHSAGDCHNECIHPTADQKSLTLGRQKKGFRSLFNSFKHHRSHRNVALDKTEMVEMSSPDCKKEVPVVQDNTSQYVTECLGSQPDVPDFAEVTCDISVGPECIDADTVALEMSVEQESPKFEFDDPICDEQAEELKLMADSSEYEEITRGHSEPCLKLQTTSEPLLKSQTPAGSSDQLNQIFGDVASLKSFDSLTGCGDIIADQEDDSITESTVSGERSRNGGKRASCYLTYQGGGEEMASPEDLDEECLHDFWENNTSEDVCCTWDQDHTDLTSTHNIDLLNSNSAQQASGMDTSSIADVLTPQSEHQESVPNSDEGYYDSTTPGPDEGQEKTDRLKTDRLPRDSYSGDALYELFAPDESLISPHYENKSKLPGSKPCEYLSQPGKDSAFVSEISRLHISPKMFKVPDFLEMPGTRTAGRQDIGMNNNCNINSKPQASVAKPNTDVDAFDEKGTVLASPEKGTKLINTDCEKRHSAVSFGNTSDPDFETFCEPKEHHLEENKPVALPYRNINSQSPECSNDLDDGQTVCFSQALEDYTKHSEMLSNSVDDLEANSALSPNMEALPTIVTFDVVDMHNEGEYDEQIQMELEDDISSPYKEFEDSYLQKDAFADCDYQILDLYEQNISNTWAVASLPRHLGLTRISQSTSNPLSLDRRSRSLDRESLQLKMPDTCREKRAAVSPCRPTERDSSPHYKTNAFTSASWQTRSEMALSPPLTDVEITEKAQQFSQAQVKHKMCSASSSSDFSNSKSQDLCSNVASGDLLSQKTDHYSTQCHLPLQSKSCLPLSTFVYSGMIEEISDNVDDDVFCDASYNQCSKSRQLASREGAYHTGIPFNAGMSENKKIILDETNDVACSAACNKLPEASFN